MQSAAVSFCRDVFQNLFVVKKFGYIFYFNHKYFLIHSVSVLYAHYLYLIVIPSFLQDIPHRCTQYLSDNE